MVDIFSIVRTGDVDEVERALKTADINVKNRDGANLLHMAIAYDKSHTASYLLSTGIDVNQANGEGMTALHTAIISKRLPVALEILQTTNIDVNRPDNYGNTALWYALTSPMRDYKLINLIVRKGGDVFSKNIAGRTPIDFAQESKTRRY